MQILQAEMAKIKLQYERLESPQDKKRLEEQAATIKMKYQKILELRNENQAKMTNQSRPQKSEPVKPVEQVISTHAPLPVSTAGGDSQSHRRAVSDPSVIIEYQQNHMSNSRTIASGNIIQYCARIRDTNFPRKIPIVPYTCALSLIGVESIFWLKIFFA